MTTISKFNGLLNGSPEEIIARAGQILPPWVSLILVLLLAWILAGTTWGMFPRQSSSLQPPAGGATAPDDPLASVLDEAAIRFLAGQHLLGRAPEGGGGPAPAAPPVELDLNWKLKGTLAPDATSAGYAIIEINGEEKVYAVGDAVERGRKLHSVATTEILLDASGKLETLRLPQADELAGAPDFRRGTGRNTRGANRSRISPAAGARTLASNPAKLMDVLRPQPVFTDGRQRGYRVYPGRKRQQFSQLGLKPGDLVTEINGTQLDDPARGIEIFRTLGEATQISVTVERNGAPQVLTLDMTQLNASIAGDAKK